MKNFPVLRWFCAAVFCLWVAVLTTPSRAEDLLESLVTESRETGSRSMALPEPGGAVLIGAAGLLCLLRRRRLRV